MRCEDTDMNLSSNEDDKKAVVEDQEMTNNEPGEASHNNSEETAEVDKAVYIKDVANECIVGMPIEIPENLRFLHNTEAATSEDGGDNLRLLGYQNIRHAINELREHKSTSKLSPDEAESMKELISNLETLSETYAETMQRLIFLDLLEVRTFEKFKALCEKLRTSVESQRKKSDKGKKIASEKSVHLSEEDIFNLEGIDNSKRELEIISTERIRLTNDIVTSFEKAAQMMSETNSELRNLDIAMVSGCIERFTESLSSEKSKASLPARPVTSRRSSKNLKKRGRPTKLSASSKF